MWLMAIMFDGNIYAQTAPFRFGRIVPGSDENHNTIICIFQDQSGFMWFGTKKGALRYDGYQFMHYKHSVTDSSTISGDFVRAITADNDGNLWIGVENGGLNVFNRAERSFSRIRLISPDTAAGISESVYALVYDSSGVLWIGTKTGVYQLDLTTRKASPIGREILSTHIMSLATDHSGNLWIATWNRGVYRYHIRSRTINPVPFRINTSNSLIWSVHADPKNRIWLCTFANGLQLYDSLSLRFDHYVPADHIYAQRLNRSNVFTVFEDGQERLWIGKYGEGMDILDLQKNTLHSFPRSDKEQFGIAGELVLSFYKDHSGVLWIGTYGEGLNLYHPLIFRFNNFGIRDLNLNNGETIVAFSGHSFDNFWLGLNTGYIVRLGDKTRQRIKLFNHNENIYAAFSDTSQNIWWATNHALYQFHTVRQSIIRYPFPAPPVLIDYIGRYESGGLLIATNEYPLIFNLNTKRFAPIDETDSNLTRLKNFRILSYHNEGDTVRWFGVNRNGLYRYHVPSGKIRHYSAESATRPHLSNNVILYLHKDSDGHLWIGTEGGLHVLNANEDTIAIYREEQGLINDIVYSITEDAHKNLWLSTPRGISCFNLVAKTFRNYDASDGLPVNGFIFNSIARLRDGGIAYGYNQGLILFHPDSIRENPYRPPIRLTSFKKFNREYLTPQPIETITNLDLSYRDYVISFDFAALNYLNNHKIQYAYKMEGFNDTWVYTKDRSVTYTNLNPGHYTFRIRASNNDGVWNEDGYRLAIYISPPFYRTWWFLAVMVLLLIGGTTGAYHIRVRTIKQQKADLEKQVSERTREILKQKSDIELANRQITEQKNDLEQVNRQLSETLHQLQIKESELIHAEKISALGDLVAGMTHEVNNPVAFIIGNMDFLELEFKKTFASEIPAPPTPKQLIEWKKAIQSSMIGARRIRDIIANLKNFSKLDEADFKEIYIHRDLDVIINLFFSHIPNIVIEKQYDPRLDREAYGCYARELNLCFRNIMVNAVQAIRDAEKAKLYEPGNGRICIRTDKSDHVVTIAFKDNGIGMPKNIQEKIFVPFFTTRDIGQGRGLGLSETYGIIQKHKGTVRVVSEHYKGTEIILTLPPGSTS